MSRWAVIFDDTPAMSPHRGAHGAAHVDYVKAHRDHILIGGGLMPSLDGPFVGGLWIVEVETYEQVIDLVTNDPYYLPEARRFQIFSWGRVLPEPVTL